MLPNFAKEKFGVLKQRAICGRLEKFLPLTEAIVIVGMRQTGKTSLLYLTMNALIQEGIPESNVFYFSLEDPVVLSAFNRNIKELETFIGKQRTAPGHKVFIFVDEIQYLADPTNFLKYYADTAPSFKFVVTGSSSLAIRKKFKDSLAGRKVLFTLHPLSLFEFLHFRDTAGVAEFDIARIDEYASTSIDALTREARERLFQEYLLYGGHPKICLSGSEEIRIELLKDIYNSYVHKDIKDLADIQNIAGFNSLIQVLAAQVGNLVNVHELSNTLNLNQATLKKYLFLLENTFVISLLPPFAQNKRKEISKMPKVYLEDMGLRNFALSDFRTVSLRRELGNIVENFVFNEFQKSAQSLDKLYFWRTLSQQEVDFVYQRGEEYTAVEVKYVPFKKEVIPSGLRSFIQKYRPKTALVVTQGYQGHTRFHSTDVYFLPVWMI